MDKTESFGSAYLKLIKKYGRHIYKAGDRVHVGCVSDCKDPDTLVREWKDIYYPHTSLPRWLQKELDAKRVQEAETALADALETEQQHTEEHNKGKEKSS